MGFTAYRVPVWSLPLCQAQGMTPALVIVHPDNWTEYGTLLELTSPFLDTPFLLAISVGDKQMLPGSGLSRREVYHYYPTSPGVFLSTSL